MKILLIAALLMTSAAAQAEGVLRSEADLPPTRYALGGKASETFLGDSFLTRTVPAMRAEAEQLLRDREIADPALARRLRQGLAAIAILQQRPADAQALIAAQRAAESKPQLQQVGAMLLEAAAARQLGGCAMAASGLRARLQGGVAEVIRDEVVRRYSDVQTASPAYYAGAAALVMDGEAEKQGAVRLSDGLLLAVWRAGVEGVPPCRAELSAVLGDWIRAPANRVDDIWAAREPAAAQFARAAPVAVAIWESGFDPSIFPGQRAMDPAEPLDGKDNDGNGVVDDSFGPTFDYHLRPTSAELPPPSAFLAARLGLQMAIEKGQLDLNYGDDTADARFFAQRAREASAADQAEDVRGSMEFLARSHGSWVASLVADGAPYVRLYAVNAMGWGSDPDPIPVVEEDVARWAALMPAIGQRLRGAHVRIVNMSWKLNVEDVRIRLLESGAETDPARALKRATAMVETMRAPLLQIIRDCPDILFVAAAGNSDQPDDIQASIPQTFDAPNLLVVGGTGSSGRATSFTSYGRHVRLYARAEGVTVRAPGGMVMKASGTSFASPLVARAAAQMLAANPALKPAALVQGLLQTATPGEGGLQLLHAGDAVRWSQQTARPK